MEKIETEIIIIPILSYWGLANKGPNQHSHHQKGRKSQSYKQWKFTIDGKYKYTERKRS